MKLKLLQVLITACQLVVTQTPAEPKVTKPGVKEVQVPFALLKPSACFKVGGSADWVLVTDDAVWVASTKPFSVVHIDPATNKIVARVAIPGEACSGLAYGFGSIWVPICGKPGKVRSGKGALVRIDAVKNTVSATLAITLAGDEGGITASSDSVWMVTDKNGTLSRIDPATNKVRQKIAIPLGSYNPIYSHGVVWISGVETNTLTAVDATSGKVLTTIPVGPKPRFLTAGAGSIWTLNQGDGSITRIDEKSLKVTATIQAGIPGKGGDIDYRDGSVWATVFDIPLTRIDAKTNKVVRQWAGSGGDSLRVGHGAVWLTDYKRGLMWRIPNEQVVK